MVVVSGAHFQPGHEIELYLISGKSQRQVWPSISLVIHLLVKERITRKQQVYLLNLKCVTKSINYFQTILYDTHNFNLEAKGGQ